MTLGITPIAKLSKPMNLAPKLINYYDLELAEDLLDINRETIATYSEKNLISLAIDILDLPFSAQIKVLTTEEIHTREQFPNCGDRRFIYLYDSTVKSHKETIIKTGKIPATGIDVFQKFPVGHPEYSRYGGNEYSLLWKSNQTWTEWLITNERKNIPVYLTQNTILYSPINHKLIPKEYTTTATLEPQTPDNIKKTKQELLAEVITSLGYDPMALEEEHSMKDKFYKACQEKYPAKFCIEFLSFAKGSHSIWGKAKKQGLIKVIEKPK